MGLIDTKTCTGLGSGSTAGQSHRGEDAQTARRSATAGKSTGVSKATFT